MSALRLLRTVNFDDSSGVSTIAVENIFSADYNLYKITFNNTQSGGAATGMNVRYIDSSGVLSDSNYDYAREANFSNTGPSENDSENDSKLVNHGPILYTTLSQGAGAVMYVSDPFNSHNYTFSWSENSYRDSSNHANYKAIGVYTVDKIITGMQFHLGNGSATFKKLSFRIYGVRVD